MDMQAQKIECVCRCLIYEYDINEALCVIHVVTAHTCMHVMYDSGYYCIVMKKYFLLLLPLSLFSVCLFMVVFVIEWLVAVIGV